jgi:hypothetical protein
MEFNYDLIWREYIEGAGQVAQMALGIAMEPLVFVKVK